MSDDETFEVLARATFRTGVQTLERGLDGGYYVTIRNRSYRSRQPIPAEKAPVWFERLTRRS